MQAGRISTTIARRQLLTTPTARAASAAAAAPPPPPIDVLYADKHLVVVNKPPGLLSQGAADASSPDMLTLLRTHLTAAAGKPPTKPVYLGLVHRLDRNVSGAMVFARRSKAAARLGAAFRTRAVKKVYVAVVLGAVKGKGGTLRHELRFSSSRSKQNMTRVVGEADVLSDEKEESDAGARVIGTLHYKPLLVFPHTNKPGAHETLLQIDLVSGRKHQIRAQLSYIGHPIVGDVKYGAPAALRDRSIALHCRTLAFAHPKRGGGDDGDGDGDMNDGGQGEKMMAFDAPLPASWRARFGEAVVAAVERIKGGAGGWDLIGVGGWIDCGGM